LWSEEVRKLEEKESSQARKKPSSRTASFKEMASSGDINRCFRVGYVTSAKVLYLVGVDYYFTPTVNSLTTEGILPQS